VLRAGWAGVPCRSILDLCAASACLDRCEKVFAGQAKCGEFANRRCWEGSIPTRAELPDFSVLQNCGVPAVPPFVWFTRVLLSHIRVLLGVGADTCVNAGFGWDEEEEECGFHSTVDCTLSASGYGAAEKERPMPMPSDGKRIDFAQWQDCHSCVAAGMPSRTPPSLPAPQSGASKRRLVCLFSLLSRLRLVSNQAEVWRVRQPVVRRPYAGRAGQPGA
jgi:hypothetical protein